MTATTSAERRGTRSGAIGLAGAAISGAAGFVLTTVLTRVYGAEGSGALFTVIGLVTIAAAVCCLGADTGLMWSIPRFSHPGRLLSVAVLPTCGLAMALAAAGLLAAGPVSAALGLPGPALLRLAFTGLPVIVAATVLLAAVRATRPIGAYVGVQMVLVPVLRPVLLILAGGSLVLGFGAWLLPMAVALLIALILAPRFARPDGWRSFWDFALPRAASVAIDASSMWVGVLLTGALAGPAEAGVFGAAGRYALAGLLIMQGLRVAVAPQLSRLLAASRTTEAAEVYRRTTLTIVVLSWPAYLLLALFAPAFLALFGRDFAAGATPLAVLAVAMLVNVGVGLVQTVLLMSGNSRGHLLATLCGLAVNVVAGLLLIPRMGALGAAIAWSLGIVCENVLAAVLARRVLGGLTGRPMRLALLVVTAGSAAAGGLGIWLGGRGLAGLAIALGVLSVAAIVSLLDGRVRSVVRL
ncbi:polysaccharide biosynthesis C-terminal domain-containing protein [Actinoplanes sp. NPDC051633]|uniref:lipopolysaccharide biosynthesis protein n=1 Tax=Actinoplanes sp. NPDC051633 TaxID=3155670 RepID=UPI00342E6714